MIYVKNNGNEYLAHLDNGQLKYIPIWTRGLHPVHMAGLSAPELTKCISDGNERYNRLEVGKNETI